MPPRLIEVALPLPVFQTFTYAVEGEPRHAIQPGSRVVVPLRRGREIGICVGDVERYTGKGTPKAILDVPDEEPALDASMLALCRFISDYYVVPLGVAMRSALPAALTGATAPKPSQRTRRVATLHRALPSLLERDTLFARSPRQRQAYELLESLGGRSTVEHLVEQLGCSPAIVKKLEERELITIEREIVARDPFAARARPEPAPHEPTPEQRAAIDTILAAGPGDAFLLHGITGSGKTLVYIEVLREVVERQGRSAIVLVPEIALTPQTVDRFRAVFGDRIAVLHSALSDGERYDAWLALRRGEKRIAVGARSAIFAPLANLGAIIVDEEHEATYKQGETPRYHAREVALVRAREAGAVVVLGSATPSLESWVNATSGRHGLLSLPARVGGGKLPSVEVVDRRRHGRAGFGTARSEAPADPFRAVFDESLESALRDRIAKKEQSILLLNRRGYSAFVQCSACGDVGACPNCSITLTYHRSPERLICHYCLHAEAPGSTCGRCGGTTLRRRGMGTQQVERLLTERFPDASVARMDVDTTTGKWAHADILDRVGRGDVDILLGTQMIAKGLDFPNVTLVGVVDADVGINLPDFRASERCFQLLSQVAGRAGRGPKGGRVLIQTRLPEHHAVRCAVTHDYHSFVAEELPSRTTPRYPPVTRLANVIFSATDEAVTAELAQRGAEWLEKLLPRTGGAVVLVGPAPCPVERIKNRWRWHLLLKSDNPKELSRVGHYFVRRFKVPGTAEARVTFDRDPVTLM